MPNQFLASHTSAEISEIIAYYRIKRENDEEEERAAKHDRLLNEAKARSTRR